MGENFSYANRGKVKKVINGWNHIGLYFGRFPQHFEKKERQFLTQWVAINNTNVANAFSPNYSVGDTILHQGNRELYYENRITLNTIIQFLGTATGFTMMEYYWQLVSYDLKRLLKNEPGVPDFEKIAQEFSLVKQTTDYQTRAKEDISKILRLSQASEEDAEIFTATLTWLLTEKGYCFLISTYRKK